VACEPGIFLPTYSPGLPDGIFSYQTLWYILEVLGVENSDIFYDLFGRLGGCYLNFIAMWYILWSFVVFSPFWYIVPRKIWQPCTYVCTSVRVLKPFVASCFPVFKCIRESKKHNLRSLPSPEEL
jgi:hypothetical protein